IQRPSRHILPSWICRAVTNFVKELLRDQRLEITLQGPAIEVGTQRLKDLNSQLAVLHRMPDRLGLALAETVLEYNDVPPHCACPALLGLFQLRFKAVHEVLQPMRHVHAVAVYVLDAMSPIICRMVS